MPDEEEWLTLREFAAKIGMPLSQVRTHVNAGRIEGARMSRQGVHRWLVPASAVDAYESTGEFSGGDWLRPNDVTRLTGFNTHTVRRMAMAGAFTYLRGMGAGGPGTGHMRISRKSVEAWMRAQNPGSTDGT